MPAGLQYHHAKPVRLPTHPNVHLKENIMNVLKHMEAIFLAAAVLVVGTSYANAAGELRQVRYDTQVAIEGRQVAVVKVSAKRPDAAAATAR
jgi:hypothetical protein